MQGPLPRAWLPSSFSFIPGASVAWQTSIATATSGRDAKALVPRAVQADLLLDRGDCGHAALELAALVHAAQRLERDVGTEAIVHRARDQAGAIERSWLCRDHDRVTDSHELERTVAIVGADVHVEVLQLDGLLARVGVEDVDRLAADDAEHGAVLGLHLDPLADQDLGVPATDRAEVDEALLVDVGDHEPDLVDVTDDGDQRRCLGFADRGDRRADAVEGELREACGLAPHGGRGRLVAGGARGREQPFECLRNLAHHATLDDRSSGTSQGAGCSSTSPWMKPSFSITASGSTNG